MARSSHNENGAENQPSELGEDFFGVENERLGVDRAQSIKTISVAYCGMMPDRCRMLNNGAGGSLIIGRIGGTMFGVEQQLRNPEAVNNAKTAEEKEKIADWGTAMVGNFNADVIGGGGAGEVGEIIGEFADVGYCYLPGGFHEGVLSRFAKEADAAIRADEQWKANNPGQSREPTRPSVTFSVFIHAESYKNPRGYRYFLTNAMRVDKAISDMRRRMQQEAILVARDSNRQLALPAR